MSLLTARVGLFLGVALMLASVPVVLFLHLIFGVLLPWLLKLK